MSLPLISCVCPTIGKTKHLEEAVYSFLIQTYPSKELIIFNNYPKIDIVFEHPQVRVVNYKGDIVSIGHCRNQANTYARGEWICTWDDDDISLANRVNTLFRRQEIWNIGDYIGERGAAYAQGVFGGAFYSEANKILKWDNFFASNSLIKRQYLIDNPYIYSDGEDHPKYQEMFNKGMSQTCNGRDYIYRWQTNTYHVSGHADTVENNRQRILNWADNLKLPDTFTLNPYWERDYQKDVDLFMQSR